MPTYVNPDKCDACKALARPACHYVCPNDLMYLNMDIGKAYNREPDMCWECYACVKICPQSAIEMRGYADVMPLGATVTPLRGTDSIMWAVKFRNGETKRFRFPTRTTPEGSIVPFKGQPDPTEADLKTPALVGQATYLGVDTLPLPKN